MLEGILVSMGGLWLLRKVKENARADGDSRVLEFSTPWRIVTVLGVIMVAFLFHHMLTSPRMDGRPPDIPLNLALWLIFFLPTVYMFLLSFVYRITYNAREIEVRMPWFSRRRILWEDVIDCTQEGWEVGTFYRVKTRRDGTFKVHALMNGTKAFLEEYSLQTRSAVITDQFVI